MGPLTWALNEVDPVGIHRQSDIHPLHIDMPNSEEYVKRGESTLITTTGRVFSLHHSATISYHFDKIFTPNPLDMTLLSNDVKLHANDWTFLKLSAVEREIDHIFW